MNAGIAFDDFGASLHVCGTADGLEHLRFDCFENEPHYHYIEQANGANTVVRIDELAVGDPIEFTLAAVEHHLPDMLRHCGMADLADQVADEPDKVHVAIGRGPRADEQGPRAGGLSPAGISWSTELGHDLGGEVLDALRALVGPTAHEVAPARVLPLAEVLADRGVVVAQRQRGGAEDR